MKNYMKLYEKMLTVRLLEDRLQKLCDDGLAGDLHFNKGQEAIAVGVCAALRSTDRIVTHHRTIAHQIAKGADLYKLVAELLGKRTGTCGGRAGEMHISDPTIGHDFAFQLVGTCIPVAAGLAYALKYHHRTDDVVAVFFGDAATSNGQFHEGVNIAAIKEVPLLMICENNHRAGNIEPRHYLPYYNMPGEAIEKYGIRRTYINGNDLEEVFETTTKAVEFIRESRTPYLIVCNTERLCWHKQGQKDIRSAEELAKLAKRDPLNVFNDGLDDTIRQTYADIVNEKLDEVFRRVEADPPPEMEQ